MVRKRYQLTAEFIRDFCARIRAGAFENVAAESLGVPYGVVQRWLRSGQRKGAQQLYQELAESAMQARANARLKPEFAMHEKDPKLWLLQGPGRATPTQPGWSSPTRVQPAKASNGAAQERELLKTIAAIQQALAAFPEARAAVIQVMEERTPLTANSHR